MVILTVDKSKKAAITPLLGEGPKGTTRGTQVVLFDKEGFAVAKAYAWCSAKDQFRILTGVRLALMRAIMQLPTHIQGEYASLFEAL